MTELTQAAASASTLEDVAEQLGTDEHGQPVLSMVHHSRNTASKQWDETWVLALTSVTRLFRTFLASFPELDAQCAFACKPCTA